MRARFNCVKFYSVTRNTSSNVMNFEKMLKEYTEKFVPLIFSILWAILVILFYSFVHQNDARDLYRSQHMNLLALHRNRYNDDCLKVCGPQRLSAIGPISSERNIYLVITFKIVLSRNKIYTIILLLSYRHNHFHTSRQRSVNAESRYTSFYLTRK